LKIVVIGANGQLGTELCQQINPYDLVALTHKDIEITDINSIRRALARYKNAAIINTAAFVRVDDCETSPDLCYQVNTLGARNVAVVAQELHAKLVFISTDYVFNGESNNRNTPYNEFEDPVPGNTVGKAKLAGERLVREMCTRHFIVRVSGLFGVAGSSGKGGNFIETMLKLAKERDELRVVNDQVFSPTYASDAARKIIQLVCTDYYGVYHVTNSGNCSWYDFTREILRLVDLKIKLTPITSAQYPQKAKRPTYSVMDNFQLKLLGINDMRPWQDALADYMKAKGHTK
jgi:dTDP-4-dehydrorhamnose reductase